MPDDERVVDARALFEKMLARDRSMDQPPPGASTETAAVQAEASVIGSRARANAAKPARRPLIAFDDCAIRLDTPYIIKGLINVGCLALLYGESGSGKSFLAIDLACHLACAMPWRGRRIRQALVVYVASEAGASIERRIATWRQEHLRGDEDPTAHTLTVIPYAIALATLDGKADLRARIADAKAQHGNPDLPLVIMVDTVSRSLAGLDENSELPQFIEALDDLRDELAATTIAVHHSGKDAARGPRGHSSLFAATDFTGYVEATGGRAHRLLVEKSRDGIANEQFSFRLRVVELGVDPDGDTVRSCVVEHEDIDRVVVGERPNRRRAGRPPQGPQGATHASEALAAAIAAADSARRAGTASGNPGTCTTAQWVAEYRRRDNPPEPEGEAAAARRRRLNARDERFRRASQHLAESGRVVTLDDIAWFAG